MSSICSNIVMPDGGGAEQTMECFVDKDENGAAMNFTTLAELCAACNDFRHNEGKQIPILRSMSAIVSIIASSILIWMIKRSHKGLKDMYYRLLLGLSVADIIFSLSQAFFNIMAPYESSYVIWNARGSIISCGVQGFIRLFGGMCGQGYNCSLNLFTLAMVKRTSRSMASVKKLEPYLHGVPVGLALVISIMAVSMGGLNTTPYGNCWEPLYDLPHCNGLGKSEVFEEDNCSRGYGWQERVNWNFINVVTIGPPIVVFSTLGIVYREFWKLEQRGSIYSAIPERDDMGGQRGSLRRSISLVLRRFSNAMRLRFSMTRDRNNTASETNRTGGTFRANMAMEKRVVKQKAMAYSIAYLLTWSGGLIIQVYRIPRRQPPPVFVYFAAIFMPLQGLYNWLIFMYPRVIAEKWDSRGNSRRTWWQAFCKALMSKGKAHSRRNTQHRDEPTTSRRNQSVSFQNTVTTEVQHTSNRTSSLRSSRQASGSSLRQSRGNEQTSSRPRINEESHGNHAGEPEAEEFLPDSTDTQEEEKREIEPPTSRRNQRVSFSNTISTTEQHISNRTLSSRSSRQAFGSSLRQSRENDQIIDEVFDEESNGNHADEPESEEVLPDIAKDEMQINDNIAPSGIENNIHNDESSISEDEEKTPCESSEIDEEQGSDKYNDIDDSESGDNRLRTSSPSQA